MAYYKCNAILLQITMATYFKLDKTSDYFDQFPKSFGKVHDSLLT